MKTPTEPSASRLNVLFLCTGNACRSQMAEGWCRTLRGDRIDAYSAGVQPHGLDPTAVRVMAEADVDISNHESKHVDALGSIRFDYVVTVCDHAREQCPVLPGRAVHVHAGFPDPPSLARSARSDEERLAIYRRVRDRIRAYIETLPDALPPRDVAEAGR